MSVRRYLAILIMAVFLGLCYVHQQFLIVEANYTIKRRERVLSELLDRHSKLKYNINALESPAYLEAKLHAGGVQYGAPKAWVVVKRLENKPVYEFAKNTPRRASLIDKFMNFAAVKAEAKTVEKQYLK